MPPGTSWCGCPAWPRWRRSSMSAATTGSTPPRAWAPRPHRAGAAGGSRESHPASRNDRVGRLLAEPAPVAMEIAEEVPARLRVERRQYQVERVLARWRLETDWWRAPPRPGERELRLRGAGRC